MAETPCRPDSQCHRKPARARDLNRCETREQCDTGFTEIDRAPESGAVMSVRNSSPRAALRSTHQPPGDRERMKADSYKAVGCRGSVAEID
jgi:hypothetical protein